MGSMKLYAHRMTSLGFFVVCLAFFSNGITASDLECGPSSSLADSSTAVEMNYGDSYRFTTEGKKKYLPDVQCGQFYTRGKDCLAISVHCEKRFQLKGGEECNPIDSDIMIIQKGNGLQEWYCRKDGPDGTYYEDIGIGFFSRDDRAKKRSGLRCTVSCDLEVPVVTIYPFTVYQTSTP